MVAGQYGSIGTRASSPAPARRDRGFLARLVASPPWSRRDRRRHGHHLRGCGRRIDVGGTEIPCASCGAVMTLPAGADRTACRFCGAQVERSGIRW